MKPLTHLVKMVPTLLALLVLGSHAAFAAGGIPALSSASTNVTNFVEGIAGLAAIGLLGLAIWEFAGHRQLSKAAWELVGVIIAGMISINAQAIAQYLGLSGSLL